VTYSKTEHVSKAGCMASSEVEISFRESHFLATRWRAIRLRALGFVGNRIRRTQVVENVEPAELSKITAASYRLEANWTW